MVKIPEKKKYMALFMAEPLYEEMSEMAEQMGQSLSEYAREAIRQRNAWCQHQVSMRRRNHKQRRKNAPAKPASDDDIKEYMNAAMNGSTGPVNGNE